MCSLISYQPFISIVQFMIGGVNSDIDSSADERVAPGVAIRLSTANRMSLVAGETQRASRAHSGRLPNPKATISNNCWLQGLGPYRENLVSTRCTGYAPTSIIRISDLSKLTRPLLDIMYSSVLMEQPSCYVRSRPNASYSVSCSTTRFVLFFQRRTESPRCCSIVVQILPLACFLSYSIIRFVSFGISTEAYELLASILTRV